MKITIEYDDGEVDVFEGVVTTYGKDTEYLENRSIEGRVMPLRTGYGNLSIEFRYHNGPRDI